MTIINTLDLDTLTLQAGAHDSFDDGMCIMEAVAYVAGEPHSDSPQCASPTIAAFLRRWNDLLGDADRQQLKPYILRLVGSKGTNAQEDVRGWMAADWLVHTSLPLWLRAANLEDQAAAVEALPAVTDRQSWRACYGTLATVRGVTWSIRTEFRSKVREAVKAELAKRGLLADVDAVAVAAADAVADVAAVAVVAAGADVDAGADVAAVAVVAAVADVAAVVAAVADAGADAVAVADAAAVAAAVAAADAVADAVAVVAAVAVAVAVAAAVADAGAGYWTYRSAIYTAVKDKLTELWRPRLQPTVLTAQASAHDLLERMLAVTDHTIKDKNGRTGVYQGTGTDDQRSRADRAIYTWQGWDE